MSQLLQQAWNNVFPEKTLNYETSLKYSGHFSDYNANIRLTTAKLEVKMSKEWKEISDDIQLGLIETLICKAFKRKLTTNNMKLYESFLKNLSKANRHRNEDDIDPDLLQSFKRVNEEYFAGLMDLPHIEWGNESFSRLGTYDYAKDTVRLSTVLEKDQNLLDYVMYHELLHKKLQYTSNNGRTLHHSKEFRRREAMFKIKDIEQQLESFLKKQHRRKLLRFF